jgi:hypothetical protein
VVVDGQGVPLACHLDAANKAEVTLLEQTLDNVAVAPAGRDEPTPQPRRLVCDPGYDSDPLRERLLFERDIELVCPHRRNRVRPRLQDGRKLRRYRRRWKGGADVCLAGEFPPPGSALRAESEDVSCVLPCGVRTYNAQTIMKLLLEKAGRTVIILLLRLKTPLRATVEAAVSVFPYNSPLTLVQRP